jgi:rhodanese-related sulfurtransferase
MVIGTTQVLDWLRARVEVALIDVREEGVFAQAHPLFAASLPLGRMELEVLDRVPRFDTPVVLYDDGDGLVEPAARSLRGLGYTQVSQLDGGLAGWRRAGGEIFRDVNSPSKAFGELVEAQRHTPSIAARELRRLLDERADLVVLDARREDEYRTMSIPGGISTPGAELVRRVRAAAPAAETLVVVNCAGRTHHRRAVAHQRRRAQSRGRTAQRHHWLDVGRSGARTRSGASRASARAGAGCGCAACGASSRRPCPCPTDRRRGVRADARRHPPHHLPL